MVYLLVLINLCLAYLTIETTFIYIGKEKQLLKEVFLKYILPLNSLCLFYVHLVQFDYKFLLYLYLLLIVLIPILITDSIYCYISNRYLIYLFLFFSFVKLLLPAITWQESILAMLFGFSLLQIIIWLSKGGMGTGDRNLLALFGYIMGFKIVVMTFVIAIFIATVMLVYHMRKENSKNYIPFGPYLIIAFLTNILFGEIIFTFYIQLY